MQKLTLPIFILFSTIVLGCNAKQVSTTPATSAIDRLIEGNYRYQTSNPLHPDQSRARLEEVCSGQNPFAVVVSCSDSRVPPELVFDQGLGDLFVIRTAGHALGDYELASIEYAVEHLNVKNVIVLGHENCGAVKTLLEHPHGKLPGHLNNLIDYLRSEPEEQALLSKGSTDLKEAIVANIQHAVNRISSSEPILKEKFHHNELKVYGAYYHLTNGKVDLVKK